MRTGDACSEAPSYTSQETVSEVIPAPQLPVRAGYACSEVPLYASQESVPEVIPAPQPPVGADDTSS